MFRVRFVREVSCVRSCGREMCLCRGVFKIRVFLLPLPLLLLLRPVAPLKSRHNVPFMFVHVSVDIILSSFSFFVLVLWQRLLSYWYFPFHFFHVLPLPSAFKWHKLLVGHLAVGISRRFCVFHFSCSFWFHYCTLSNGSLGGFHSPSSSTI